MLTTKIFLTAMMCMSGGVMMVEGSFGGAKKHGGGGVARHAAQIANSNVEQGEDGMASIPFSSRRRHHHKSVLHHRRQSDGSIKANDDGINSNTVKEGFVVGQEGQDELLDKRDDCVYGSWQCNGMELQRCFNNAYQTLRTCPSGTVCSTDGGSTGCIWPFQQSSDANSVVTNAVVAATGGAQGAKGVNPTSLVTSWTADSTTTSTSTSTTSTWSPSSSISSSGSTPSAQVTSSTLSGVGQDLVHSKSHISSSYSSWTNSWWTPSASSTWAAASSAVTSSSSTSKWHANSAVTTTTTTTSAAAAVTGGGSGGSSGGSSGSGGSGTLLHTVIYSDNWLSDMPHTSALSAYNKFILAFWMCDAGPVDNAVFWQSLGSSQQQQIVAEYNAQGISVMVSAFGSTDAPTSNGVDPTSIAQQLAQFVISNNLNGVDIDYEDDAAFNDGAAEAWLITFQNELRSQLPSPQYIISHAPQAPWFDAGAYPGGGYLAVDQAVGSGIDFYSIQFYNQGENAYVTCETLLTNSGGDFPGTSIAEINQAGVPMSKLVIGKPIDSGAAANGYMDPATLNTCVTQALGMGWSAGVMYWEYDNTANQVMLTVSGL